MMELGLEGRVALVAGGTGGMGKAMAFALAREGVDVAISARGKDELEKTANEISSATRRRVLPIPADMGVLSEVQRFVASAAASFGRIDILVYAAGEPRSHGGSFVDTSDERWRSHLDIKLLGCVRCAREVIPHMQKNHWGRIIIVAGNSARVVRPYAVDNGPVCAGLANFGKQIANELGPYGILVNTIHPDSTMGPRRELYAKRMATEQGITREQVLAQLRTKFPIGRIPEPEDIASLMLFLCSQHASAITGQSISVDGGAATGIVH